jgi:DNA-binding IclR family transcriptional regulator
MNRSTPSPAFQPYRVKPRGGASGAALHPPTERVLAVLVGLCPVAAGDVTTSEIAERSGIRQGSVVVILRTLVGYGFAMRHAGEPESWAPTMAGRVRARALTGAARGEGRRWLPDEARLLDRLAADLDAADQRDAD